MKVNKQKIDEIKLKLNNIKGKIKNNYKEKVPNKYYALLLLMLLLGIVTLSNNIRRYNLSKKEDYIEYNLEQVSNKEEQVVSNDTQIIEYKTAESSISTSDSILVVEETVETISSNTSTKYIMPLIGDIIKEFAVEKLVYSETLGMWKTHPGIDIKAELGESVKAVNKGIVKSIKQDSFYGNTIIIEDIEGYNFIYSNLDNNIVLKEGENVEQGDVIGIVGVSAAGELADETHLHFEIIKDEKQVNPLDLIN